ncbi:M48 family metallopeptidase [Myroides odoratimimus]|uniref:M48 family metallopeptidase n=1 Tax=Myroides odoratimimus TaxID=76832 RepID=UPI001CE1A714|nr:SprT family zinc-dependent metalloprotease [Myroides odoratimimus]MCA4792685.1 M48 family metallopeptidase [Myroides odoratimimus]MCA4819873.1 M48 family metallopeptidase [Myroides odoratimimus]MDM1401244.1 M48 family metallopeptidase [Myroides odoratimimus]MDM1457206.1 M48 family metallopeptidase [Myroides odoratimimus]MEC4085775.1 SprT family zinc-dependent metalloprotease [Myroides odoratimimus]
MLYVEYGSQQIYFDLEFRDRKTIAIEVNPDATVVVKAPIGSNIDEVKAVVERRSRWIVKSQLYFEQFLPQTPPREYVIGETHLYLGRSYRLKFVEQEEEAVKIIGGHLVVYGKEQSSEYIKAALGGWYYSRAMRKFSEAYKQVYPLFDKYAITHPVIKLMRMKNRWGSCTVTDTIRLNPELIKVSMKCIEYVLIHELCHLIEPNHSKRFYAVLSDIMPDWQRWKLKLEKSL